MSVRLLCALGEIGSSRAGAGGPAGWEVDSNPVVGVTLKGLEICLVEEPIRVFEVLLGVKPDPKPVVEVTPTGLEMSSFLTWSFLGGIVTVDSLARSTMAKVKFEEGEVGRVNEVMKWPYFIPSTFFKLRLDRQYLFFSHSLECLSLCIF